MTLLLRKQPRNVLFRLTSHFYRLFRVIQSNLLSLIRRICNIIENGSAIIFFPYDQASDITFYAVECREYDTHREELDGTSHDELPLH